MAEKEQKDNDTGFRPNLDTMMAGLKAQAMQRAKQQGG